jgi:hypothetical protein
MSETQKIYDEWSPAHSVARVAVAASGVISRAWNSSQALAKYFVRNEPALDNIGALVDGDNTALTAEQLKHGFQYSIGSVDADVIFTLPTMQSLLDAGLRIGDSLEFWALGDLTAPATTSHGVTWAANGADTASEWGDIDTNYTARTELAQRVTLHIISATSLQLIVK